MLSKQDIEQNKNDFINLIKSINRDNANLDGLISWLEQSDFFIAPASTKYHEAYPGGLCEHSLNVYYKLCDLSVDNQYAIDVNSLKICALLHDISKTNYYEQYNRNVKHYSENGSSTDNKGKFDWISETAYKVKESNERFIYANHEMTSEFIVRQFIPLRIEESVAILHHMGKMNQDCAQHDISTIFVNYTLALLLHVADMFAVYLKTEIVDNNV